MIKLSEDEQAGYDILYPHMPADLAIDIIKHRRAKKAKLTARVARSLLREYQAFGNVEKAAEIHLTRGWVAFECAWVKQASRYVDQNHPSPRRPGNMGDFTAEFLERYDARSAMGNGGHQGAEHAMALLAAEKRH